MASVWETVFQHTPSFERQHIHTATRATPQDAALAPGCDPSLSSERDRLASALEGLAEVQRELAEAQRQLMEGQRQLGAQQAALLGGQQQR